MDATKFIVEPKREPFYIVGSTRKQDPDAYSFKIEFIGKEVTEEVTKSLETKKKIKEGQSVIVNRKARKPRARSKKTIIEQDDESNFEGTEMRSIVSGESNISEMNGSDGEGSNSGSQKEDSQKDKPSGIDSLYDMDDNEDVPIKLIRAKKTNSDSIMDDEDTQDVPRKKVSKRAANEAAMQNVYSSMKSEQTNRRFMLYGELTRKLTCPLFGFILKVVKRDNFFQGESTYTVLEILDAKGPGKVTYEMLRKSAAMTKLFGEYTVGVVKKKKKLNFTDEDRASVEASEELGNINKQKKTNNNINNEIKACLEKLRLALGDDYQKKEILPEHIKFISDPRMLSVVNCMHKEKKYFRTLSVLGYQNAQALGEDTLALLNLTNKKNVFTQQTTYENLFGKIKQIWTRIAFTRPILDWIMKKNIKDITEYVKLETVEADFAMIIEASSIYQTFLKNKEAFGDTSCRESSKQKWSQATHNFFDSLNNMHDKTIYYYSINARQNGSNVAIKAITPARVFKLEMDVASLMKSLSEVKTFHTKCDIGDVKVEPYFDELRNICNANPGNVIIVTTTSKRKFMLSNACKVPVAFIGKFDEITSSILPVVIIDRAHGMTLQELHDILSLKRKTQPIVKKIYFFGNKDILPSEGQPFKDICECELFNFKTITNQYNLNKVVGTFETIEEIKFTLEKYSIKTDNVSIIFNNMEELIQARTEAARGNGYAKLGISPDEFYSILNIDASGQGLIRAITIFCISPKTRQSHVSKLFDVTTNKVEKPSIMFYSKDKVSFQTVGPTIPRCTSFANVLTAFWETC